MYKILITTHGRMCMGLKDTISLFSADVEAITTIPFYTQEVDGEAALKTYMDAVDNEDVVVVFTDIAGGSVNQKVLPYINDHIHVISGVNLAIVLEFLCMPPNMITSENIHKKMEEVKASMVYMNEFSIQFDEEDE